MSDFNAYNPINEGLINAVGLADRIKSMALRQSEFEESKRRTRRNEGMQDEEMGWARQDRATAAGERTRRNAREDEADTLRKIQAHFGFATNPALQELDPGQTERTMPLNRPAGMSPLQALTIPNQITAPVGDTLDYGGHRYAIHGQEEMHSKALSDAQAMADMNLHNTAALEKIKNPEFSINLPGMTAPMSVPRTAAGAAINALSRAESDKQANKRSEDANASRERTAGIRANKKGGGEKGLTEKQKRDELKGLEKEERGYTTSSGRVPGLHEEMVTIGADLTRGQETLKNGHTVDLDADGEERLKRRFEQLTTRRTEVLNRKEQLGYSKPATMAHVKAYAQQKGIDLKAAQKEFEAKGYYIRN
jgi:hypothetical protein